MNNIKKHKKIIISLIFSLTLITSTVGYKMVSAQLVETRYEWDREIEYGDGISVRYIGGNTYFYRYKECFSNSCSTSCPEQFVDEDFKTPGLGYGGINLSQDKVILKEIANGDWNFVCDSEGYDETWANRVDSYSGCKSTGGEYLDRQYAYVDFGVDSIGSYYSDGGIRSGKDMNLVHTGSSRVIYYGFDESQIITIKNNSLERFGLIPDDIKRLEIYVEDEFLKTVFPDPSDEVSFSLSASELLNLGLYNYSLSPDVEIYAYGENSFDSIKMYPKIYSDPDMNIENIAPDITIYGNGNPGNITAYYLVVNSLNEPIYVNDLYITPEMAPISIKAKGDNFIKGNGWFLKIDDGPSGFDYVNLNEYVSSYDRYYQKEPIGVYIKSSYRNNSYEKNISNVMIDGDPVEPSQYYFDTIKDTITFFDISEGIHNIKYDLSVTDSSGSTWNRSEDDEIIIVKNNLDVIRNYSLNNNKKYIDNNRININYQTTWGSTGTVYDSSLSNAIVKAIDQSQKYWSREEGTPKWVLGTDYEMREKAIDYNGSIFLEFSFFDGDTINKTINVNDLVSVSKIKDIEGVGTAFHINFNNDYAKKAKSFNVAFDKYEISYGTKELQKDGMVYNNSFRVGRSQYGISKQPDYYNRYKDPDPYSWTNTDSFSNFISMINVDGDLNIINVPFNSLYRYIHNPELESCPSPNGIDIPVDDPLPPPTYPPESPPNLDNFKLTATTTTKIDCYAQGDAFEVNLSWGDDFTDEIGYQVYLDSNGDGIFSEEEEIIYLQPNSTSTVHDLSQDLNFAAGKSYTYQVKVLLESNEYTSEDSITVPEECYTPEPLTCGTLVEKSSTPSETEDDMCSLDASVVVDSLDVKANKIGWNWKCTQDTNTVECSAYCPDSSDEWVCGGVCQPTSQPCNNTCTEGDRVCNGQCVSQLEPCNNSCDDGYVLDETGTICIIDEDTTSSVDILQFVSNPRIINPGDSCLFDWQIDTDNSNLISCSVSSDNPAEETKLLNIIKNIRGTINGSQNFDNVNSTTEYTLTCNEYDPDTDTVGSVIDSKKTKCMINPAFYEF